MAPIYVALGAWEAAELPGVAVFSLVTLFIITITLLALCSRCQKHSFDLDHSAPEDRNSNLVRVVQLETTNMSMDNPGAADITRDEKYLSTFRPDGAAKPAAARDTGTWRSHTLDRDPQRMINGSIRQDLTIRNQNPNPSAFEPSITETSQQSEDQTVSTHTPEPHEFQTISLDDQTDQTEPESPPPSYTPTQHLYETAEELRRPGVSMETKLNPYATYESIMTNSTNDTNEPQEGWSNMPPPPPPLAEELNEGPSSPVIDTYARVSRKNMNFNAPVELTLEDEAEEAEPPLPQRS
ncbi:uncharacterized protein si:ch73-204p21.2 [Astyanax mexicanus]|uniref:uncharacterized protein si:ch73-204p21.2 n=1 Tax=Astyanax mexicanus TaxID=7994 RepID=UPI0020CB0AEA|nr:uncharacterized protein si:ch73-204p21.2 [Astyanax mexicanus]